MTDSASQDDLFASAGELFATLQLSIVIPVYNEENTILEVVRRVREVGLHEEIVIVNDASTDGTADQLAQIADDNDIVVMHHSENRGKGAALQTAFSQVSGEWVLIQDADLEYDPSDYPTLLQPVLDGEAEVVYGSRFLENAEQDPSWLHRFGNRVLTSSSNFLTGQQLTDMETCYKLIPTWVLREIELQQPRFGFEPEITAKISRRGIRIHEVPIRYDSRDYDEGKKIGMSDGISAFWCMLRYAVAE